MSLRTHLRDPIGGLGYNHCKFTGRTKKRWATVGSSYPIRGSRAWLTYSSSTSSSFGVAVSYDRGVSFSGSGSRTTSDEWGQDFAKSGANRTYRVQVRYRQSRCDYYYGGRRVRENSRRWSPHYQTGGTRSYRLSGGKPDFRHCAPVAAGTWHRGGTRHRDYTLSYGVKFKGAIGIDLSSRRAYTNGARLYYSSTKPRRLCGNNDFPSKAGKIRERKRKSA